MSKESITNYSEPLVPTGLFIDVGCTYTAPPNRVKEILHHAVVGAPLVLTSPPVEVLLQDFSSSAITYRIKFWIESYADDDAARDQVRCAIYYALHRHRIEIPYPIQIEYQRQESAGRTAERTQELESLFGRVAVFHDLAEAERSELVQASSERLYGDSEAIVRQGESGSSMFVICSGKVRVVVEPVGHEVASIAEGGYFGEMSLLTGEPRSASVYAAGDCTVLELTAETLRRVALANPAVVERISLAVATRRTELERQKLAAVSAVPSVQASPQTFLARVRQFLRLP
jgi:CRP-like cAMP-binding protein